MKLETLLPAETIPKPGTVTLMQPGALELVPAGEGPDVSTLATAGSNPLAVFDQYRAELEKLKATAEKLTVTSIDQTLEIKMAGEARLALKKLRCEVERKRKELGADALERKRRIDSAGNSLIALIEPLERRMQEQEDFVEREEARLAELRRQERTALLEPLGVENIHLLSLAGMDEAAFQMLVQGATAAKKQREEEARIAAIDSQRIAILLPLREYLPDCFDADLGTLPDDEWEKLLAGANAEKAKREEEARKAEAERLAKIEHDRLERIRLAEEARQAQAALKAQQEAAEAAQRAMQERLDREKQEAEARLAALQAEADRKAALERKKERKAREIAEEEARKKQEAAETAQREAEATLAAMRAKAQEEQDRKHAEAQRLANAGDAELLINWRDQIRNAKPPTLKHGALSAKIADEHRSFLDRIDAAASHLKGAKKQTETLL